MSTKISFAEVPHPSTRVSSRKDGSSINNSSSGTFLNENEEEESSLSRRKLQKQLSRTSLLLLDYRQFKAARTIQAAVRGWLVRRLLARRRCAAIIIQREWRRFAAMKNYYPMLERILQQRIEEHYHKSATRIQALWRGFWVREHIHDQFRMKRSQRMAAVDLLQCIAYKLHYLLRTYHIPGVYSLRNSNALSKVEKLLISISFKQGNQRTFVSRIRREADQQKPKKYFQNMSQYTRIPYMGPNFSGLCDSRCVDIFKEPDIDARMHQVLRMYEEEMFKQQQKCPPKTSKTSPKIKMPKTPTDFCSDVVQSMRRWNIVAPNKFEVRKDVFKNPENVAQFLAEIESMYEFMTGNCYCSTNMAKGVSECGPC